MCTSLRSSEMVFLSGKDEEAQEKVKRTGEMKGGRIPPSEGGFWKMPLQAGGRK